MHDYLTAFATLSWEVYYPARCQSLRARKQFSHTVRYAVEITEQNIHDHVEGGSDYLAACSRALPALLGYLKN